MASGEADTGADAAGTDQDGRPPLERAPRAAAMAYAAVAAVAAGTYAWRMRAQWFYQDDFSFLVGRDGGSLDGWFAPHAQHWVTLPVLVSRVLWNVVGIRSHQPYLAVSIATHLAVATALRAVLRRNGVSPWMSTAAAAVLLLFGAGGQNVAWSFMITFTGALAFGLALLLVADRDATSPGHRAAVVALGLGALACSGVGLVMIAVAGGAVWARRGWRAALWATVPAASAFVVWLALTDPVRGDAGRSPAAVLRFAARNLTTTVERATRSPVVAVALVGVVVLGVALVAAAEPRSWSGWRQRLGTATAMAIGAAAFAVLVARSRAARGDDYATRGRFLYVTLVLLLPVVALAADAVVRRWRWTTAPVLLLLLAGIPANVRAIGTYANPKVPPASVLALAASPGLETAPADLHPFGSVPGYATITAGWLRDGVAAGRIPDDQPGSPGRQAEALATLALAVRQDPPPPTTCTPISRRQRARITPDRPLTFSGRIRVIVVVDGGRSRPRAFGSFEPRQLGTTGPPLDVEVQPVAGALGSQLCQ